jgi:hypothetical protein
MGASPEPTFGLGNVVEDRRYQFRVPVLKRGIEIRSHVRFIAEVAHGVPPSKFRLCHRAYPRFGRDRP